MTMVRKQFFIDREASRRLRHAAASRGVSEAELIREGIERIVAEASRASSDWRTEFRAAVDAITPGAFDDLSERLAENRKRRAQSSKQRRERNWARRQDR